MTQDAYFETARRLLADAMERPVQDVDDNASLETTAAWDSLCHVRLIMGLEDHLGGPLPARQALLAVDLTAIAKLLRQAEEGR